MSNTHLIDHILQKIRTKLDHTGARFNDDVDMQNHDINNLKINPQLESSAISKAYLRKYIYESLSETLLWEYYTKHGNCLYKVDRGLNSEVSFDSSTRKVSVLHDQTLSRDDAEQTNQALQLTLCTKANRQNDRYYLYFDGTHRMISDINLNPINTQIDVVNIFIVYKLNA